MIADLITTKQRLQTLVDELRQSLHNYSLEIDSTSLTHEQVMFQADVINKLGDLEQQVLELEVMIDEYTESIFGGIPTISKKAVPSFKYNTFIDNQDDIRTVLEKRLRFPLQMDIPLIHHLFNTIYHWGMGQKSGIPVKHRPQLLLFLTAVAGWMLMNEFGGGQFIIGDGLSVKLQKRPYIIQVERFLKLEPGTDSWGWFSEVVAALKTNQMVGIGGVYYYDTDDE